MEGGLIFIYLRPSCANDVGHPEKGSVPSGLYDTVTNHFRFGI